MPAAIGPASGPRFSVIVPVYRHWALLPDLLAALRAQTIGDAAFEILIVDNDPAAGDPADGDPARGDPAGGDPAGDRAGIVLPGNAALLAEPRPGAYAARNAAAARARAPSLVFTDADCRPLPGWLAAFAEAEDRMDGAEGEGGAALLAGPIRMTWGAPPTSCELFEALRGIPQARYARNGYAATANLAVPAALFRRLGGFDASRFSGGDADFCRRAGLPVRLVPEAVVAHPCRAGWADLTRKIRRVKGGQIAAGSRRRRLAWTLRTLTPPLRALARFARAEAPLTYRARAIGVLFALWGVELAETARLLAGGRPERG